MSEILEKHMKGNQEAKESGLKFFRDMSDDEKAETERWAAVILELTGADADDVSEISHQFPRLVDIPDTSAEVLSRMIRNCDSISNPSQLPLAMAELVSVCQQRNSRSQETESLMRRLEGLTEMMLVMQQQHYVALSDAKLSAPISQEMPRSESCSLSPQREQILPRCDPPADWRPSLVCSQKKGFAPDPPENDSVHKFPSVFEKSESSELRRGRLEKDQTELKVQDPKMPEADSETKIEQTKENAANDGTQKKSTPPDDTLIQMIVAEVLKKLQNGESSMNSSAKEPPNSEPKQLQLPDGHAMQVLVRDAQEKLVSKGISGSSGSSPNDWIVERLRPTSLARGQAQNEETIEPQQRQHEIRLRMPNDDPPEEVVDSDTPDRQPVPETRNANRKQTPSDPPESKQNIASELKARRKMGLN